jgi:cell shape-determining protein MreC
MAMKSMSPTDKLQSIINRLMANDRNASWDECETLDEVADGLREAMKDYDETEETYQFYAEILSSILSQ